MERTNNSLKQVREFLKGIQLAAAVVTLPVNALIFVGHLVLGLPVMKIFVFMIMYFGLALLFFLASMRVSKYLPMPLLIVYALLPLPFTLLLGFVTFANSYVAGPPYVEFHGPIAETDLNPLFVHISDSHFLGEEGSKTKEGQPRDKGTFRRLVSEIIRLHPRYLFITGDVTDSGRDREWKQFDDILLTPIRAAGIKLIMAPGNHDLQPAFLGAFGTASPAAVLVRRYLEEQIATGQELMTVDRGGLKALVDWKPPFEEVAKEAKADYRICIENPLFEAQRAPKAWLKGCELASRPENITNRLVTLHTQNACSDWFPLLHHDEEAQIVTIVMCSTGQPTATIGYNAVGSFGTDQVQRLHTALSQISADTNHVFILLHHPLVRRWRDRYSIPEPWWKSRAWEESPMYNYALLYAEWKRATEVVDTILEAMETRPATTFSLLYGHRHERSLSAIATERGILRLSEAPALGENAALGFRACYLRTAIQFECRWISL